MAKTQQLHDESVIAARLRLDSAIENYLDCFDNEGERLKAEIKLYEFFQKNGNELKLMRRHNFINRIKLFLAVIFGLLLAATAIWAWLHASRSY